MEKRVEERRSLEIVILNPLINTVNKKIGLKFCSLKKVVAVPSPDFLNKVSFKGFY
jgi:hypothetical protein